MLLITELLDAPLSVIKEEAEPNSNGKRKYFIEGIFLQGDKPNRNGRIYSSHILAKEAARYTKELIEQNRAYGELGHPTGPSINLDRVSHMIKSLQQEGSNFIGKAKITDTPMGNIVMNLLDEGATLGISSRGLGTLKPNRDGIMEVQDDFRLATAGDVVADPSGQQCYLRGVMENVDWVWDEVSNGYKAVELANDQRKFLQKNWKTITEEAKLKMFESFLKILVKN